MSSSMASRTWSSRIGGQPARLIVDLPSQTLDALAPTGELGQFALTPSESGDHALYLVLAKPRFGNDEVDFRCSYQ